MKKYKIYKQFRQLVLTIFHFCFELQNITGFFCINLLHVHEKGGGQITYYPTPPHSPTPAPYLPQT